MSWTNRIKAFFHQHEETTHSQKQGVAKDKIIEPQNDELDESSMQTTKQNLSNTNNQQILPQTSHKRHATIFSGDHQHDHEGLEKNPQYQSIFQLIRVPSIFSKIFTKIKHQNIVKASNSQKLEHTSAKGLVANDCDSDNDSLGYTENEENDLDEQTVNFELQDRMLDCLDDEQILQKYRETIKINNQFRQSFLNKKPSFESQGKPGEQNSSLLGSDKSPEEANIVNLQGSDSQTTERKSSKEKKKSERKGRFEKYFERAEKKRQQISKKKEKQNKLKLQDEPDIFDLIFTRVNEQCQKPHQSTMNAKPQDSVKAQKQSKMIQIDSQKSSSFEVDEGMQNIHISKITEPSAEEDQFLSPENVPTPFSVKDELSESLNEGKNSFLKSNEKKDEILQIKPKANQLTALSVAEKVIIRENENSKKSQYSACKAQPSKDQPGSQSTKEKINFTYSPRTQPRPEDQPAFTTIPILKSPRAEISEPYQPLSTIIERSQRNSPIFLQKLRRINSYLPDLTKNDFDSVSIMEGLREILYTTKSAIAVIELLSIKILYREAELRNFLSKFYFTLGSDQSNQQECNSILLNYFLNSNWQDTAYNKIEELEYIKPTSKYTKRSLQRQQMEMALNNFVEIVTHYLEKENYNLSSAEGKARYFRVRQKMKMIERNLAIISEDLYEFLLEKSTFPEIYRDYLTILKNGKEKIATSRQVMISEQVRIGRKNGDPVSSSVIGKEVLQELLGLNY